jgi:hypothetical protein
MRGSRRSFRLRLKPQSRRSARVVAKGQTVNSAKCLRTRHSEPGWRSWRRCPIVRRIPRLPQTRDEIGVHLIPLGAQQCVGPVRLCYQFVSNVQTIVRVEACVVVVLDSKFDGCQHSPRHNQLRFLWHFATPLSKAVRYAQASALVFAPYRRAPGTTCHWPTDFGVMLRVQSGRVGSVGRLCLYSDRRMIRYHR